VLTYSDDGDDGANGDGYGDLLPNIDQSSGHKPLSLRPRAAGERFNVGQGAAGLKGREGQWWVL
jgi:hypothetical protein